MKRQLSDLYLSVLMAGFCIASVFLGISNTTADSSGPPADQDNSRIPLAELHAFAEAYYQIKTLHIKPTEDGELINAAIQGMAESLDDYSTYLRDVDYERFEKATSGAYAGIGVVIVNHDMGIEIVNVIEGSPAQQAGLKAKMIITQVDDHDLNFLPQEIAFDLIKGEPGTSIRLMVAAAEFAKPREFQLVRQIINIPSVASEILPNQVGYIAIREFTAQSPREFAEALQNLLETEKIKRLILDLRDNGGGVMESSLAIADQFINRGNLLITKSRESDSEQVIDSIYSARHHAPAEKLETFLLINANSASASEILAAALQDHQKALLIGEKSYGKGSIQSIIKLGERHALKITTAEYFSPLGRAINGVGLEPDIGFSQEPVENFTQVKLLDDPQVLQAYTLALKSASKSASGSVR